MQGDTNDYDDKNTTQTGIPLHLSASNSIWIRGIRRDGYGTNSRRTSGGKNNKNNKGPQSRNKNGRYNNNRNKMGTGNGGYKNQYACRYKNNTTSIRDIYKQFKRRTEVHKRADQI
eukprot:4079648-Ditylum_brightwellii.AAC.1